ncbi:MAG: hypothetical protein KatS3mg057_0887 [Herpetosiphonaceae bacterium]|nr:MAG: hypothetical protein KatS3mg057_0887 [Herpetosiphonaceae bacterium]
MGAVQWVLWLLGYPGLMWGLILTLLMGRVAGAHLPGGGLRRGLRAVAAGGAPVALLLAALLPLAALSFLPWPLVQQPLAAAQYNLLLFWGFLEASFVLALLPGLISASPYAPRAAMREAQIGFAGRMVLWLAVGVALAAGPWFEMRAIPVKLLALATMLLVLPAAAAWGPFSATGGITPGGAEAGLGRAAIDLARWGRWVRLMALASLAVLAVLPEPALIAGPLRLGLAVLALALIAIALRALRGRLAGRPLPDALRYCWWRALPLALLGIVVLLLG